MKLTRKSQSIYVVAALAVLCFIAFGAGSAHGQNRKITGTVVETIFPNAGPQVVINASGTQYQVAFTTGKSRETKADIALGMLWDRTVRTLRRGDRVEIGYHNITNGLYMDATRIRKIAATKRRH